MTLALALTAGCSSTGQTPQSTSGGATAPDSTPAGQAEDDDDGASASANAESELPMDEEGWILVQAVYGNTVDLGLVRPDGSEAARIPGATAERWHPDWSPDGDRIAYDWDDPAVGEGIAVMNRDGSDDATLLRCQDPCFGMVGAAWTPDGQQVGFSELRDDLCYLGLIDVTTEEVTRILEHPECEHVDTFPRFSPDGDRVVFQREGEGGTALYVATIDGQDVQQLTDYGLGARPDWSPDGDWIVFMTIEPEVAPGHPVAIHRIRSDGTDFEQLTEPKPPTNDLYPRYLPDGRGIIYSRCTSRFVCETRLMGSDGKGDHLLFEEVGLQTVHVMLQPTPSER